LVGLAQSSSQILARHRTGLASDTISQRHGLYQVTRRSASEWLSRESAVNARNKARRNESMNATAEDGTQIGPTPPPPPPPPAPPPPPPPPNRGWMRRWKRAMRQIELQFCCAFENQSFREVGVKLGKTDDARADTVSARWSGARIFSKRGVAGTRRRAGSSRLGDFANGRPGSAGRVGGPQFRPNSTMARDERRAAHNWQTVRKLLL